MTRVAKVTVKTAKPLRLYISNQMNSIKVCLAVTLRHLKILVASEQHRMTVTFVTRTSGDTLMTVTFVTR